MPVEVPSRYQGVRSDLAAVNQWCDAVLDGAAPKLLLLGPYWSGKTHQVYGAVNRLLDEGLSRDRIEVLDGRLSEGMPSMQEVMRPSVLVIDALGDLDLHVSPTRVVDEPLAQADLALRRAGVKTNLGWLVNERTGPWLCTATSAAGVTAVAGHENVVQLLDRAEVVTLAPRPRPKPASNW